MTFDDAIDAFATSETMPAEQIRWVLAEWATNRAGCRTLLADYVDGKDWSERTEHALRVVILLLGERADAASFTNLCRLAVDTDRANSVFGEHEAQIILPSVLISTFDGHSPALYRIVESPEADEFMRAEMLATLAYLVRVNRIPESEFYQYLAQLPDRLPETTPDHVWYGWVNAVAMMGFAGLSHRAEQILQSKAIDPQLMSSATFWEDLRAAQANPQDMSGPAWEFIGPMVSALAYLETFDDADFDEPVYPAPPEPIRNPLRDVGRNDPCPCGSGRKFKKCCLAA